MVQFEVLISMSLRFLSLEPTSQLDLESNR